MDELVLESPTIMVLITPYLKYILKVKPDVRLLVWVRATAKKRRRRGGGGGGGRKIATHHAPPGRPCCCWRRKGARAGAVSLVTEGGEIMK